MLAGQRVAGALTTRHTLVAVARLDDRIARVSLFLPASLARHSYPTANAIGSPEHPQAHGRPRFLLTSSFNYIDFLPIRHHGQASRQLLCPFTRRNPTEAVRAYGICTSYTMSTPVKATPVKEAAVVDSPGTWRHPRLNEITQRRNATTFSEKNIRQIAYNLAALLVLWSTKLLVKMNFSPQS